MLCVIIQVDIFVVVFLGYSIKYCTKLIIFYVFEQAISYEFTAQQKIGWILTSFPRKDVMLHYIACWIYGTRIWSGLGA